MGKENLVTTSHLGKSSPLKGNYILSYEELISKGLIIPECEDDFLMRIDPLIRPAVDILRKHGFHTIQSCQGGEGHAYPQPTVDFFGDEFDGMRAYELCRGMGMCVLEFHKVYSKEDIHEDVNGGDPTNIIGEVWVKPHISLIFIISDKTGTIFFDH